MLQEYQKYHNQHKGIQLNDFIPVSYPIKFKKDSDHFLKKFLSLNSEEDKKSKWIYKPGSSSRGKGIEVFNNLEEAQEFVKLRQSEQVQKQSEKNKVAIIQKYIENTALLENKKFDFRCYLYIATSEEGQELVFYQDGIIRRSLNEYDLNEYIDENNKNVHLTNIKIQQKNTDNLEETTFLFEKLQKHMVQELGFTQEKAVKTRDEIKKVLTFIAEAFLQRIPKNQKNKGTFQHFGIDIMFDEDYHVYLLEANIIPALLAFTEEYSRQTTNFMKSMMDIQTMLIENPNDRQQIIKNQEYPLGTLDLLINQSIGYNFIDEFDKKYQNSQDDEKLQQQQHHQNTQQKLINEDL